MGIELSFQTYIIVLPLVFLAALVDAIGGGGGLISLPAYSLAGLPYDLASGCNKFSATFGGLSATVTFIRSKKILWLPALCAVLGALPGAVLGTRLSILLGTRFMSIFMIFAVPVIGVFTAFRKDKEHERKPVTKKMLILCFFTGLLTGTYDGFFGPGTGTFLILLFTAVTGMDMVSASATAKPVNLASNISSLITRIAAGQVIFALAIPAVACSITGAWVGSKLVLLRGARFIRYVMLGVLALLVIKLVIDLL